MRLTGLASDEAVPSLQDASALSAEVARGTEPSRSQNRTESQLQEVIAVLQAELSAQRVKLALLKTELGAADAGVLDVRRELAVALEEIASCDTALESERKGAAELKTRLQSSAARVGELVSLLKDSTAFTTEREALYAAEHAKVEAILKALRGAPSTLALAGAAPSGASCDSAAPHAHRDSEHAAAVHPAASGMPPSHCSKRPMADNSFASQSVEGFGGSEIGAPRDSSMGPTQHMQVPPEPKKRARGGAQGACEADQKAGAEAAGAYAMEADLGEAAEGASGGAPGAPMRAGRGGAGRGGDGRGDCRGEDTEAAQVRALE